MKLIARIDVSNFRSLRNVTITDWGVHPPRWLEQHGEVERSPSTKPVFQ